MIDDAVLVRWAIPRSPTEANHRGLARNHVCSCSNRRVRTCLRSAVRARQLTRAKEPGYRIPVRSESTGWIVAVRPVLLDRWCHEATWNRCHRTSNSSGLGRADCRAGSSICEPLISWAHSIACFVVWGVILAVRAAAFGNFSTTHDVLVVFAGWCIAWVSATVARSVYPPPKRWFQPGTATPRISRGNVSQPAGMHLP